MLYAKNKYEVSLLHIPTGISMRCNCERQQYKNRARLLKRLVSLLNADRSNCSVVHEYDLGNEDQYPYDLSDYRDTQTNVYTELERLGSP